MTDSTDVTLTETTAFLTERAQKKFGKIPAQILVDQVLAVTQGADFPVRRAALEALERRMENAEREGLHVVDGPDGSPWGQYQIAKMAEKIPGRRRREQRPYLTELYGLNPLSASCSCPDFLKGSLGLCKHILAVLEHWHSSPKRVAQLSRSNVTSRVAEARLVWNPIWPLVGPVDRLLGLEMQGSANGTATAKALKGGKVANDILTNATRRMHFLKQALIDSGPIGRKRPALATDAATRVLLTEELAAAEAELRSQREAERAVPFLKGLKRHLYPYQAEGVSRFLNRGRLLLADDMGLGKTTQAIACCHALFNAGIVKRGLVVTPAALKSQWHREWLQTTDVPVAVVDGVADERLRMYRETKKGFLIVNYELILRDFEPLAAWSEQLVVLDEAQRIKNYATKSAVYVKALPAARRLVLTGTPMENRLDELASILDWVDDRALAPKWRLPAWHIRFEGDGMKSRSGARNLDTLRTRLSGCLVRRVRTEVLSQLPQRSDTRVPVEMTVEQREEHDALADSIKKLMMAAEKRPLRQEEFLRLMQLLTTQRMIANGLGQIRFEELWPFLDGRMPTRALLDSLFAPKLTEFRRLVESLVVDQGRKIIVFSQWRRMLKLADWSVRDLLKPLGHRTLFFTGAESSKLRTQSVVDFHDDPKASILFLSDAGGVGLNLQKAANACINLELPWNPAVLEQRIGRIYRLGQKLPIDVYNLVSERSIEARIASTVSKKQALFKGLFDGSSNEVKFEDGGGFISEVRKLLDAEQPVAPELPPRDSVAPEDLSLESVEDTSREMTELWSNSESGPEGRAGSEVEPSPMDALEDTVPTQRSAALDPASVLGQLKIERDASGGLSIQAAPEVAGTIADLFETMAKLLRTQTK